MSTPSISLCMIVRNEETLLNQCLSSVKELVSEIVLVDTGSQDRTVEIAESFGASVLHQDWSDDFSSPRNLSLKHARGDWILVLDADEAIDHTDHARIVKLCHDRRRCYLLTQRHYSADHRLSNYRPAVGEHPKWEREYPGFFESSLVRLFPNHCGIEYQGRIHELVEHSINQLALHAITHSGIIIHHYGHTKEVSARRDKAALYTPLGEAKLSEQPTDWKSYFELGVEHNVNGRHEESALAFSQSAVLNPTYLPTWVNAGYVLCQLGRYDDAIRALQRALALNPNCDEALCNLAVVHMRLRQYRRAEILLINAVGINPQYVNAWCNLGKTLCCLNRLPEAVLVYERALQILPKCTTAAADLEAIWSGIRTVENSVLREG